MDSIVLQTNLDGRALQTLVDATVRKTIETLRDEGLLNGGSERMLSEAEAADLFGVERHVLRDARGRGELEFHRFGKFVRYDRSQLDAWKERNKNRQIGE